ncbi:WhiB family transcriptional regulator [Streptomyces sp. HC307]|uniref:WhiB family transcriptional regulator n=1 Tax=Streptomyces flavusporus TaxID=3385496 RepID=UPI003916F480
MYWRERAACLHEDPDLFFPIGNTGPTLEQIDEAKAVCRCPVVEQCLDWAIQVGQVEGIWGGMTDSERRAVRRRQARQTKNTVTTAT